MFNNDSNKQTEQNLQRLQTNLDRLQAYKDEIDAAPLDPNSPTYAEDLKTRETYKDMIGSILADTDADDPNSPLNLTFNEDGTWVPNITDKGFFSKYHYSDPRIPSYIPSENRIYMAGSRSPAILLHEHRHLWQDSEPMNYIWQAKYPIQPMDEYSNEYDADLHAADYYKRMTKGTDRSRLLGTAVAQLIDHSRCVANRLNSESRENGNPAASEELDHDPYLDLIYNTLYTLKAPAGYGFTYGPYSHRPSGCLVRNHVDKQWNDPNVSHISSDSGISYTNNQRTRLPTTYSDPIVTPKTEQNVSDNLFNFFNNRFESYYDNNGGRSKQFNNGSAVREPQDAFSASTYLKSPQK